MSKKLFVSNIPKFSENSINSFCWFLESGLSTELRKLSSSFYFSNPNSRIRIYSDEFMVQKPAYSSIQCKNYGLNYSIRLYVPLEISKQNDNSLTQLLTFFGEIPLMTENGTFIINGCERVVINQIIRSPGVYFKWEGLKKPKISYSATLISMRGSWLKFEFSRETNDVSIRLNKATAINIYSLFEMCGLQDMPNESNLCKRRYAKFPIVEQNRNCEKSDILKKTLPHTDEFNDSSLLSYQNYLPNDNTFFRVFNERAYSVGFVGRERLNQKFGLCIPSHITRVTIEDIIAISNSLIQLHTNGGETDDIDNLKNRRIRSVGELIQLQFSIGINRLERSIRERLSNTTRIRSNLINSKPILAALKEFFGSSQLSQFMDQTNAIASLTHKRRVSSLGPGGLSRDRLSLAVRDIHPSQYGRICPIETPEGQNTGLLVSLASYVRINENGFLETPFFRICEGNIINSNLPLYLTSEEEEKIPIAPFDSIMHSSDLKDQLIPIKQNNEYNLLPLNQVKFISVSPIQNFSIATSLIPFLEHDDANRALMGSNMQRQAVPLLYPSKPIVGTGLEQQIVTDSGAVIVSKFPGKVKYVSARTISVETEQHEIVNYHLQKFIRSNQATCINQRPIVWPYEIVSSGQIISDGPSTCEGELALGQNLLVAYMPWDGYNYEDAVLINERLVQEDLLTSLHIEKFDLEVRQTPLGVEKITRRLPNTEYETLRNLDSNGIIYTGRFVTPGDILVGKITPKAEMDQLPESRLLSAIFGEPINGQDSSLRVPKGIKGRVTSIRIFRNRADYEFEEDISLVRIFIVVKRKIKIGDKISGRHGNKGIISRIVPRQDMPFLPNGTPIDILLNPLGVPSRMNLGQIFECLLGLAGSKLKRRFKIRPFDEIYGAETSRKLIHFYLEKASKAVNEPWLFDRSSPGKVPLRDGRSGILFDNSILVGQTYILKLIHQVDDKIHSRATGPYSLITQQPLKGKARRGGQRFGEMEVWALQAFGCAYTLQELLTLKSDDMEGRNEVLNAIVLGLPIPKPGVPESFNVLIRELHSLGLDISFYKMSKALPITRNEREVDLLRAYEENLRSYISSL